MTQGGSKKIRTRFQSTLLPGPISTKEHYDGDEKDEEAGQGQESEEHQEHHDKADLVGTRAALQHPFGRKFTSSPAYGPPYFTGPQVIAVGIPTREK